MTVYPGTEGLTVYEELSGSLNNPDAAPSAPPPDGMWVWWRLGPHPQGVWLAIEVMGDEGKRSYAALLHNNERHPIFQDRAHGSRGDWGHYVCHGCGYYGEGYPEPGHHNECQGICQRKPCVDHPSFTKRLERLYNEAEDLLVALEADFPRHAATQALDEAVGRLCTAHDYAHSEEI